jgi:hypothetical protein
MFASAANLLLPEDNTRAGRLHTTRNPTVFSQRLKWFEFVAKHGGHTMFRQHLRMSLSSFEKLLSYISGHLLVDTFYAEKRGGAIIPELQLYCTIRFLAGGSYSDIFYFCGISKSSFYSIIWKTIHVINKVDELLVRFPTTTEECEAAAAGFRSVSSNQAIDTCVCVVDGYHCEIIMPSKKEAKNVRSFFSGHYQTYGVNVQAACDHNCRFVFLGLAGPGVMGDRDAIDQIPLGEMIENLPGLYCVIGDCAYTPTEHLVPIFGGADAKGKANDDFNFFASQCRIRIEMAFGIMVQKWGILQKSLRVKLKNVKHLLLCIARLHNFCIEERLSQGRPPVSAGADLAFSVYEEGMRRFAAEDQRSKRVSDEYPQWSLNRNRLVQRVRYKQLKRPTKLV